MRRTFCALALVTTLIATASLTSCTTTTEPLVAPQGREVILFPDGLRSHPQLADALVIEDVVITNQRINFSIVNNSEFSIRLDYHETDILEYFDGDVWRRAVFLPNGIGFGDVGRSPLESNDTRPGIVYLEYMYPLVSGRLHRIRIPVSIAAPPYEALPTLRVHHDIVWEFYWE